MDTWDIDKESIMTMVGIDNIDKVVKDIVNSTKIVDIHSHLYPNQFEQLMLLGPDELITYHYLVAEALKVSDISYEEFWKLSKEEKANLIYKILFIDRTPISEACKGVLTTFSEIGIDINDRNLDNIRKHYSKYTKEQFIDLVFEKANLKEVYMTNDPFDRNEEKIWKKTIQIDDRFKSSLRLDFLLNDFRSARYTLLKMGYNVSGSLTGITKSEIKRFLRDWIKKTNSKYMAVSLPPDFVLPENSIRALIIEDCILEVSYELNIPFAMMIGVKRLTNPELEMAGDSVGKASLEPIEYLCKKYNRNKFMITMLSRENQHELTVLARKYRNLMIFGAWWFLNNPTFIKELTSMRLELLGLSFIPQHSDARIIDQLIYKWKHSRENISLILIEKYKELINIGWDISKKQIKEDVKRLFEDNFTDFLKMEL